MKNILVVEDELRLRNLIRDYLVREGYGVTLSSNGEEGLSLALKNDYDLVLLDVMMPFMDGITMLKRLRLEKNVEVILLTAKSLDEDKLSGYDAGADDYITKPFSPRVLMAKIAAVFNRQEERNRRTLKYGELEIDLLARRVYVKGEECILTKKEFDLLVFLSENENIAFSRESIVERVWGFDYDGDLRTVDTGVRRLREKIGIASSYITTVRGTGYRFMVDSDD